MHTLVAPSPARTSVKTPSARSRTDRGLPLRRDAFVGAIRTATRARDPRSSGRRSEEHTSELQSHSDIVCRLLLEKKKKLNITHIYNIKIIILHLKIALA